MDLGDGMGLSANIEDHVMPIPESGCWVWMRGLLSNGYGITYVAGKQRVVHRVTYERKYGPVPVGLQLGHKCRVRSCCNPDHVEPVTQAENQRRGVGVCAKKSRQTHCLNGHELNDENTYPKRRMQGHRTCKICRRTYALGYQRRLRAARAAGQV